MCCKGREHRTPTDTLVMVLDSVRHDLDPRFALTNHDVKLSRLVAPGLTTADTPDLEPEFLLVSAGFDCLAGDPLGGMLLEPEDLHAMTRAVMEAAAASAGGRVVALLEGGYVPARVGQGVVRVVRAFAGLPSD